MAGVVVHIAIADAILTRISMPDAEQFLLGNIAPDGVMMREGYVRAMKKHSHLRDDIPDADFLRKDLRQLFNDRLTRFTKDHVIKGSPLFSETAGYASHLITDELFIAGPREKYVSAMRKLGIDQHDRRFYHSIVNRMDRVDHELAEKYPFVHDAASLLKPAKPFSLLDYIYEGELGKSRDWVVTHYFIERGSSHNNADDVSYADMDDAVANVITFDSMKAFIADSADEIIKRLRL